MKHLEKLIAIAMLLFAIGFNLWLYRLEPTSLVDPNDNAFQFALVDRTNQMWDFAAKNCSLSPICFVSYLVDHWVPNWAQGYNLPFYYSHIPQVLIVASWRLGSIIYHLPSLFTYYHLVIYVLMCLFPLSIFLALRVIKLPWLAAGIGALLASQISTDGLYGLDPPSFLFRGWGLSSQLFAMIWLPLAIAYSWKLFTNYQLRPTNFILPVFFLVATTMGHLGIGFIALLSLVPLALVPSKEHLKTNLIKLAAIGTIVVFFLSYWIIPIFLTNDYHNVSFWDPVWKFDSYGWRLTMDRLLNGELFDWGRFPTMTFLVFLGIFVSLLSVYYPFALLFAFWLLLYFGRATWGGLIDLVPGMSEFHISRFIVGLHIAGLFLIPIGISSLVSRITNYGLRITKIFHFLCYFVVLSFCCIVIYPQTIRYATHNDFLIAQANEMYKKVQPDVDALMTTLKQLQQEKPGRIYAGRGGNWGKDFKVAETNYFMHLSTYGLPLVLWLPETWSPNSDVEQYFSDDNPSHYPLFGFRYVVTPADLPKESIRPFWKLIKESPSWKIYEIAESSYITSGVRPATVSSSKLNYVNLVRLWIVSDAHEKGLYPEITFAKDFPKTTGLPNFRMLDEVTYKVPDGSTHNLFSEPPAYMSDTKADIKILSESQESDMIFKTQVEVGENCVECIVILKQSSHPNWRVTVDGKEIDHMNVFPFFVAVPVNTGTHDIIFSYKPSGLKIFFLVIELFVALGLVILGMRWKFLKK